MNSAAEILGDELVRTFVLINDFRLPRKIISHDVTLKVLPFQLISRIQNAISRRKVLPAVHQLPPVSEPPGLVHGFWSFELSLQAVQKCSL